MGKSVNLFFCSDVFSLQAFLLIFFAHAAAAPAGAAAADVSVDNAGVRHSFKSMYAFGDSLTDTGNALLYVLSINADAPEIFFHYPTGRFSDGRVIVDFLAKRAGAPRFLPPYLGLNDTHTNDGKGPTLVNFAVGGATAQNVAYLNATYNLSVFIPYSTDKQLQWFSTLPISNDKEALSKALVYFGAIGGNDYTYALRGGFSTDEVIKKFVPNVIKIIRIALEFLIERGAKYLVVEGGFPIGCPPAYHKLWFVNARTNQYGCVEEFQRLNKLHDKLLQELVYDLTIKHKKDVHIIFFDQLKAYFEILKHPLHYGFRNTTDPCVDLLGSTNFTSVKACTSPSTYLSWDGSHYTEATNRVLFKLFYTKGFVTPYPNFLSTKNL